MFFLNGSYTERHWWTMLIGLRGFAHHAASTADVADKANMRTYMTCACRRLAVVAAMAGLAACAPRFDPQDLEIITETSEVANSRAMLVPDLGGPPVLNVLESRYTNAYTQEIILETNARRPGQNKFLVSFILPGETGGPGTRDLEIRRLDPYLIAEEMAQRFPDIAMNVSPYFTQNRLGPFGYAVGRSAAGDICIYAWQTVNRERHTSLIDGAGGRIDIRLDLCGADTTEAALLETMYGFTINAYLSRWNWQPYDGVPPVRPEIGMAGAEVRPLPLQPLPLQIDNAAPEPVRARAPRRTERPAPAQTYQTGSPLDLDTFLNGPSHPAAVAGPRAVPAPFSLLPGADDGGRNREHFPAVPPPP